MKQKPWPIYHHIDKNFREYSLYSLEQRGIPNWYDGLINAQRIALVNAPKSFSKTISLVGECISNGYHHGNCLEYDAKIHLTDGTTIKIGEWSEKYPDSNFIVECKDDNGNLSYSIGHSPRIGQITNEIFEIELENGEIIKCTGNHPFFVNGKWILAKDLMDGDDIFNL